MRVMDSRHVQLKLLLYIYICMGLCVCVSMKNLFIGRSISVVTFQWLYYTLIESEFNIARCYIEFAFRRRYFKVCMLVSEFMGVLSSFPVAFSASLQNTQRTDLTLCEWLAYRKGRVCVRVSQYHHNREHHNREHHNSWSITIESITTAGASQ